MKIKIKQIQDKINQQLLTTREQVSELIKEKSNKFQKTVFLQDIAYLGL